MKKHSTVLNLASALCAFLFWGSMVCLLLPSEQYGALVRTVVFAAVLFLLAILSAVCVRARRFQKRGSRKRKTAARQAR